MFILFKKFLKIFTHFVLECIIKLSKNINKLNEMCENL